MAAIGGKPAPLYMQKITERLWKTMLGLREIICYADNHVSVE